MQYDVEVLEFINRRFKKDCNWLDGNCYYFALILKDRFPSGRIWYDVIDGHFFFEYDGRYYDYLGFVDPRIVAHSVPWGEMDKYDPLVKERIVRDCVM